MTVSLAPGAREEGTHGGRSARDQELEASLAGRLERQIDLPAWLIASGFHLSLAQTDPTVIGLSDRYGETLLVRKDLEKGSWSYSSESNGSDRGTVVHFIVRRDDCTVADCLTRLAACLDTSATTREAIAYREALRDRNDTLHRAEARHVAALEIERNALRDLERMGVERGTFDEWRFGPASTVLRNPESLEHSRYRTSDRAMVFIERPIDALAYERAHRPRDHLRSAHLGAPARLGHRQAQSPRRLRLLEGPRARGGPPHPP